jgi:FtsK/SpoIIIE family
VVTRQAPPRPPAPTVRPAHTRPVDRLTRLGTYVLVGGLLTAAALVMVLHRSRLGLEVAGISIGLSLLLFAVALRLAVRRQHVNPGPWLLVLALLAAVAGWEILPFARLLVAIGAAIAVWRAVQAGRVHSRRRAVKERCAQALGRTKSLGGIEQVSAALTEVVHRRRGTELHLGPAPGAAWRLEVTRWAGRRSAQPRQMVLTATALPAGVRVSSPDFKAEVRTALKDEVGLKYVTMSADPLTDRLTIVVLDSEPEQEQKNRQEQAVERTKTAAGHVFKGVEVKVLDWDATGEPANAPVAWPLRKIEVSYEQDRNASWSKTQEAFCQHMAAQLYGDTGRLRAQWFTAHDKVILTRRNEFPAKVLAAPWTAAAVAAAYGDQVVLVYSHDEDSLNVGFQLTETDNPHMLLTGGTGSGKSVSLRLLMMQAALLGIEVRGCDPKRVEMRGLRGWPNVTRIATRVPDMIALIEDTWQEMHRRYDLIEAGIKHESDFRRILLVIDEFLMFSMLINDWWAGPGKAEEGGTGKEHPVMRKLRGLIVMARGGLINIVISTQRGDAVIFPEGVRDSLGERVALGQQSQQSAQMMFGDPSVGRDIEPMSQGVGHTKRLQDVRIKVGWVPDPANWTNEKKPLTPEERAQILSFLPPGTHWDGPAGYTPASPDAPDSDDEVAVNPATRLLWFARIAMQTLEAHVTAAPDGGAPSAGTARELAAHGWARSPVGHLEAQGTWIGTVKETPLGPRIYLHPDRTMEVARRLADPLGVAFGYTRNELDEALRDTGLLATETEGGKTRYTVRRQLPGNDLADIGDRQRVWDLPAGEVIYLPDEEPEGAAAPSGGPVRRLELPAARTRSDDAGAHAELRATGLRAGEIQEGMRIRVRDERTGELTDVTVDSVGTDPELPGPVLIESRDDQGVPHTHRMSPDDPVQRASAAGDET